MYQKKTEDTRCRTARLLDILDGKWNLMLLCALSDGEPLRYGELRQRLNNISDMALTNALKALSRAGIIQRQAYNEVPPRVEYQLTPKGQGLIPVVRTACRWGEEQGSRCTGSDPYCWKLRE